MGNDDSKKDQVKCDRHCSRQPQKRDAEGGIRRVMIVEEKNTRQVILEPENQSNEEEKSAQTMTFNMMRVIMYFIIPSYIYRVRINLKNLWLLHKWSY